MMETWSDVGAAGAGVECTGSLTVALDGFAAPLGGGAGVLLAPGLRGGRDAGA